MFRKALQQFGEYLQIRNYSSRSIEEYVSDTGHFLDYLAGAGVTQISEITKEVVKGYQHTLYYHGRDGKALSLGTQSKKLYSVKAFCKFLVRESYLLYDPAGDIDFPKLPRRLPRDILSLREVKRLLDAPDINTILGIRDKAILELLYSAGMRNTELRDLRICELDTRRGELRITSGKGGKSRIVPIGEAASHYISLYLEHSRPRLLKESDKGCLFLSHKGEKLSKAGLGAIVKKYARMAKIRKNVGCHTLRHTCATHMLKGKADLRYIQELLGHQCLSTTQIYTKVELSDLRKVHAECHPRNRP